MRTRKIQHKKHDKLFMELTELSRKVKRLRNTANFIIRNTMTGIKKEPDKRTQNENDVLEMVFRGIDLSREAKDRVFLKAVHAARENGSPSLNKTSAIHKALNKPDFSYPTPDKWYLAFIVLDAILKNTKNPYYYDLPAQVSQQALKKVDKSWRSYFRSLNDFKANPSKYYSRPNIPGYLKSQLSIVTFTNQTSKLKNTTDGVYLSLSGCSDPLKVGGNIWHEGKYIRTEVRPYAGAFEVLITTEDGAEIPSEPEHPKRILAIDPGVDNFAACANNFGAVPFIISGKTLKSKNQWFNKERARLCSELTRGKTPKHAEKHSHKLDSLSYHRDNFFRDFFFKASHHICRRAAKDGVEIILVGHNEGQKQGINIGHVNNQTFMAIPFLQFINTLTCVAAEYGIPVIRREESYTSKADFFAGDSIPVHGQENAEGWKPSGRRIKRGLYRSATGVLINADVQGAANLIRKQYPDAFDGVDASYLIKTVEVVGFRELYKNKKKNTPAKKHLSVISPSRRAIRNKRKKDIFFYRSLFAA